MKAICKFFLLLLLISLGDLKSQTSFSCNQTWRTVYTFYSNNTIDSIRYNTDINGIYLCGPNTIITDTNRVQFGPWDTRIAFLNSGTKYIFISQSTPGAHFFYVKSTATLEVNATIGDVRVYHEPGATLTFTGSVTTYSCSIVDLPPSACSVGIYENSISDIKLDFFPNPASNYLFFNSNQLVKGIEIRIYNNQGQLVLESELRPQLSISELANGIYTLHLGHPDGLSFHKKLIIAK